VSARSGLARRSVTAGGLWFFAVSASAPMTALVGGVVTSYAHTGVVGMPLSFLLLTAALCLLTVGYVAMSRHVAHAAPFYALLALGLGRAWGVAGGLVALVGYNAVQIALYGLLGATLAADLGGPWWVWAALVWLVIAVFGVLRVDISARLIAALLVVEIGVIVLFDVAAFTHPAGGSVSLDPLRPSRLFVGGLGGVFAFSIASFLGYESGPAYGEEARTDRAVGRATLAALAVLGPFYAVCAWALSVAEGPDRVAQAAARDPNLPFTILSSSFGPFGPVVAGLGQVLLVTSVFAAMLSFHGTAARYTFGFARERLLPTWLASTGTGNRSQRDAPIGGSVVQSLLAAVVVAVFAVLGADPVAKLFTWLAAVAAFAVFALLWSASIAALRWFHHGGGSNEGVWPRLLAPGLAVPVGLGVLAAMALNMDTLLGAEAGSPMTVVIPGIVVLAVVAGLCWAGLLRLHRREVYEGIGRGRPHRLAMPDQRLADVRL
jgi:amino acid transporter